MLVAAVLLLALQVEAVVDREIPRPDEIQTRLEACGFESVSVKYDDELYNYVVSVADEIASDEEVYCAAKAMDETFYMAHLGLNLQKRYDDYRAELARSREIARARIFFSDYPELGEPPKRNADESDWSKAKRIEAFCGPRTEGAFTDEFGGVAISPEWLRKTLKIGGPADDYFETVGCLRNAATLAELPIGFVGNERAVEGDPAVAEPAETPTTK